MKKIVALALSLAMACSLGACSKPTTSVPKNDAAVETAPQTVRVQVIQQMNQL